MEDTRRERPGFLKKKPMDYPEIPCKLPKVRKKDRETTGSKIMDKIGNDRRLYEDLQGYRESNWHETCEAFEANPSFYNAYMWLQYHPLFYWFGHGKHETPQVHEKYLIDDRGMTDNGVEFAVHRVDPVTEAVSDDRARNTAVRFWYEICITQWGKGRDDRVHDWKRDSGAPTYEEAVIQAAKAIHAKYGNGRSKFDKRWNKHSHGHPVEKPKEDTAE